MECARLENTSALHSSDVLCFNIPGCASVLQAAADGCAALNVCKPVFRLSLEAQHTKCPVLFIRRTSSAGPIPSHAFAREYVHHLHVLFQICCLHAVIFLTVSIFYNARLLKNASLQSKAVENVHFSSYCFMSGTWFLETEGTFLFHYLHMPFAIPGDKDEQLQKRSFSSTNGNKIQVDINAF